MNIELIVVVTPMGQLGVRMESGDSPHKMLFSWALTMYIPNLNLIRAPEDFVQT